MPAPDLIICPGIDRLYALAEVAPSGATVRLSEHDTAEAVCDARGEAKAAAADALIALAELSPALKQKAA